MTLKRTPLYEDHVRLGAKMVPFGGWEMPVQYEGILAEYEQTRKNVAVFDTSHMGEFFLQGGPQDIGFDRIVSQRLDDMSLKSCRYGMMLNEQGGVIDDLIVYRIQKQQWMAVVNGATTEKDERQFLKYFKHVDAFRNESARFGKLDIQGPQSRKFLTSLIEDIGKLDYYTFDEFDVLGKKVIVSRTGYTGELGFEIYYPWEKTSELWNTLIRLGAKPAGLGARDVLRIEMGYSLYGHELAEDISPLDAGLTRFIDWEKDFIGKKALQHEKQQGIKRKIICFVSESRRSPRESHKIYLPDGQEIGVVSSGTFSPHLNKGAGLGFVEINAAAPGDRIYFGDERNKNLAEVVKRPIYQGGSLKN